MIKFIRNFYAQIIIYLIWVNNQVATLWSGDLNAFISISGNEGFPKYYHYWILFDYSVQRYLLWALVILSIAFPLKGSYRQFAINSSFLVIGVISIEIFRYLYHGNNDLNEQLYFAYITAYTLCLVFMAYKFKFFKDER